MIAKNFIDEEIQGYHSITTLIREDIIILKEQNYRDRNITIQHFTIRTNKQIEIANIYVHAQGNKQDAINEIKKLI